MKGLIQWGRKGLIISSTALSLIQAAASAGVATEGQGTPESFRIQKSQPQIRL